MERPYISVINRNDKDCYIFIDEITKVYDNENGNTIVNMRDNENHHLTTPAKEVMKLIDEANRPEGDRLLVFNTTADSDSPSDFIARRAVRAKDVLRITVRIDGIVSIRCKSPGMTYMSGDSFESIVAKLGWEHKEVKEVIDGSGRLSRKMDKAQ